MNESQENEEPVVVSDPFDEWWSVYPRKTAKGTARTAYKRAKAKAAAEVMLDGARRYRDDPNRVDTFTKHAATWLNGECWSDPPIPPRDGAPVAKGGPRLQEPTAADESWEAMTR